MTWPADFQARCCQYTGIPLNRLHWNHTAWCYHLVVFQWQSRAHLHNWNTPEYHWSHTYTGMPLGLHWLVLAHQWCHINNPVIICIIGTHWTTTGRPLGAHWKHRLPSVIFPMASQCKLGSKLQAHWIATGLSLNYQWLRVGVTDEIYVNVSLHVYPRMWTGMAWFYPYWGTFY